MRKRLIAISVLLLAGMVITLVVAWGCALWVPTRQTAIDRTATLETAAWFFANCPYELSASLSDAARFEYGPPAGLRWESVTLWWPNETYVSTTPIDSCSGTRIEAGFPLPALRGEAWFTSRGQQSWNGLIEAPGPIGSLATDDRTRLPVRPILSGFVFNTIAYAALLWMLTIGPVTMCRIRRERRARRTT